MSLRVPGWQGEVRTSRPRTTCASYDPIVAMHRSRVAVLLDQITYPGHTWYVAQRESTVYLRVEAELPNNDTGEVELQRGRPWIIRPNADDAEIIRTAWLATETFLLHEAREKFLFRGKRVMNPHFEV